jgi:very-short-patch-repair endonuclease
VNAVASARRLRKNSTWAEDLLWRWLRDRRFSQYKFRRQQPLGPYILDFFCPEAKLSIELDGGQHGFPEQQAHDLELTAFLAAAGIKEIRFWNGDLRRKRDSIQIMIFNALTERAPRPLPAYASNTTVAKIPPSALD